MPMIKTIPPDSYPAHREVGFGLIKRASSGLRGNDLSSLIKQAGYQLADQIRRMPVLPGDTHVLLNALGSAETVGFNRNWDDYPNQMLINDHKTFEKFARFYRGHKNKNKAKSYGVVKLAYHNPDVQRVDLVVALNGNKESAQRNGGLIADDELDLLEKDAEIQTSMSCRVPHDVCSGCHNKARTREDYCTKETCKYGGLRDNMGALFENGVVLGAKNPRGTFFDISHVGRHADRTSVIFGKVASAGNIGGAELSELLNNYEPEWLEMAEQDEPTCPRGEALLKLARQLASMERTLSSSIADARFNQDLLPDLENIEKYANSRRSGLFRAFADQSVLLSPLDWLRLTTGETAEKCAEAASQMRAFLPSVFRALDDEPYLTTRLLSDPCRPGSCTSREQSVMAAKAASSRSIEHKYALRRAWEAALCSPATVIKSASSVSPAAKELCKQYAVYQIGLLEHLSSRSDSILTAETILRHNRSL